MYLRAAVKQKGCGYKRSSGYDKRNTGCYMIQPVFL
jgi:hypothetical protein